MPELIFIRHGQTQANADGRWQGWSDYPLTPLGQTQAQAVAQRLASIPDDFIALYTSPLLRARQTAQAISNALGLDATTVESLKEIDFGELNNISLEEMEAQHPNLFTRWQDKSDMEFQWPGGEQRGKFFARAAAACDLILSNHSNSSKQHSVIVVAHGGTLRACLAHLLPDQFGRWWTYSLDNAGLTRVQIDENEARLIVLNDTTHQPTQKEEKNG